MSEQLSLKFTLGIRGTRYGQHRECSTNGHQRSYQSACGSRKLWRGPPVVNLCERTRRHGFVLGASLIRCELKSSFFRGAYDASGDDRRRGGWQKGSAADKVQRWPAAGRERLYSNVCACSARSCSRIDIHCDKFWPSYYRTSLRSICKIKYKNRALDWHGDQSNPIELVRCRSFENDDVWRFHGRGRGDGYSCASTAERTCTSPGRAAFSDTGFESADIGYQSDTAT